MAEQLHTWTRRRDYHEVWTGSLATEKKGWTALGIVAQSCGCLVDTYSNGEIWEPCMAHEADGHLAAISEQDGMHVARCLVLICPWTEQWFQETDAVAAAQGHWRTTRAQPAEGLAGSN